MNDREEIIAARRHLGRQLAAWRARTGLVQRELARLSGYSRGTVASAEREGMGSARFWAAVDRALDAGGRLVAEHAQTEATVQAVRQRTTRAALAARAAATDSGQRDRLADAAVLVQDGPCPNCHYPLTMTSQLLTTLTLRFGAGPAGPSPA